MKPSDNKDNQQHTPTPWIGSGKTIRFHNLSSGPGLAICTMAGGILANQATANRDFIVTACNSHEENKRDAERYRYLRSHWNDFTGTTWHKDEIPHELDAAVDAEIEFIEKRRAALKLAKDQTT